MKTCEERSVYTSSHEPGTPAQALVKKTVICCGAPSGFQATCGVEKCIPLCMASWNDSREILLTKEILHLRDFPAYQAFQCVRVRPPNMVQDFVQQQNRPYIVLFSIFMLV